VIERVSAAKQATLGESYRPPDIVREAFTLASGLAQAFARTHEGRAKPGGDAPASRRRTPAVRGRGCIKREANQSSGHPSSGPDPDGAPSKYTYRMTHQKQNEADGGP
jgi:hypothetical protein